MRILVATAQRGIVGGAETYLLDLLPLLCARGHDVSLLYERQAEQGRTHVDARAPGLPSWSLQDDGVAEVLRHAAAWRPDVCFSHGLQSCAAEAGLLEHFPAVLFAHTYHGTCVSGTKRYAWPSPRPCHRTLGRGCLVAYFPHRCGGLNPRTLLRLYRVERQRQALLPRYRAVVVGSQHMWAEYHRHGVAAERLHLAPLFSAGIRRDPEPPGPRPFSGRVLFAGRLTDLKGGGLLVEALCRARTVLSRPLTLVVAGEGPERAALEQACRQAALPAEFHGWLDEARLQLQMRQADVLAVPSVWPEPFGHVGLEAGCLGLPAVAYAVGGIPDWLLASESGELAPGDPPTADGLADAFVRALADPDHLARLRLGAWHIAGRFTRERHADAVEAVLEGVVRDSLAADHWGIPAAAGGSERLHPAAGSGSGPGGR
jgi:glycosyltransferase involved in cell wall biosynthesis